MCRIKWFKNFSVFSTLTFFVYVKDWKSEEIRFIYILLDFFSLYVMTLWCWKGPWSKVRVVNSKEVVEQEPMEMEK
jgi:hypothetical protein